MAGAVAGQAAIPVPVLGAVIGGVVGAMAAGHHASSLVKGSLRLTGSQARGGDDLVRCVEHGPGSADAAPGRPAPPVPDAAMDDPFDLAL